MSKCIIVISIRQRGDHRRHLVVSMEVVEEASYRGVKIEAKDDFHFYENTNRDHPCLAFLIELGEGGGEE